MCFSARTKCSSSARATVPGLRQAKQLVGAIRERLGGDTEPKVIINRFVQKMMSASLRKSDVEAAIGDAFLACLPNDYGLVREAIDRGVPLDEIKKATGSRSSCASWCCRKSAPRPAQESGVKRLALSWARS